MRKGLCGWSVVFLLVSAGCDGKGGKKNHRPDPVILDPHLEQSFFAGDIDFRGRATDDEDGTVPGTSLRFEVYDDATDGLVGSLQADANGRVTIPVNAIGDYTAILIATDSDGKEGRAEQSFHVSDTVAEIQDPNNEGLVGIATPFDVDGYAETRAPGLVIANMNFIGTSEDDDTQVFNLPVAASAAVCNGALTVCTPTVTPSLLAGRYKIHLEVTTTGTAVAEDNVFVNADAAPVVAITSPAPGSIVAPGVAIQFSGTATDAGGDVLDIEWLSSIDGSFHTEQTAEGGGVLPAFDEDTLVRSKHTITLRATDPLGLSDTASIDIYVQDATPLFVDVTIPGANDTDIRSLALDTTTDPDLIWAGGADVPGNIYSVAADNLAVANTFAATGSRIVTSILVDAQGGATGARMFGLAGDSIDVLTAGGAPAQSNFTSGGLEPNVNGISQNANGIYYATEGGLYTTDNDTGNGANHNNGVLGGNALLSVAAGAGTVVWVGSDGDGLIRADFAMATPALSTIEVASDVVHALFVDAVTGEVWAGTDDGLSRFDPATSELTNWGDELPDQTVRAVTVDASGVVWVGTDGGAARFDPVLDLWMEIGTPDLPTDSVRAVVVDAAGAKWFGCADEGGGGGNPGGIVRYDGP